MSRLSRALLLAATFGLALPAATPALPLAQGVVAGLRASVAFDLCPGGGVLSCALARRGEAKRGDGW
jgi:hypothetical protein